MIFLYPVRLRRGVSFIFDTIFIVFMPAINYREDLNPPFFNSRDAKAENVKKQFTADPFHTPENPVKKFNLP